MGRRDGTAPARGAARGLPPPPGGRSAGGPPPRALGRSLDREPGGSWTAWGRGGPSPDASSSGTPPSSVARPWRGTATLPTRPSSPHSSRPWPTNRSGPWPGATPGISPCAAPRASPSPRSTRGSPGRPRGSSASPTEVPASSVWARRARREGRPWPARSWRSVRSSGPRVGKGCDDPHIDRRGTALHAARLLHLHPEGERRPEDRRTETGEGRELTLRVAEGSREEGAVRVPLPIEEGPGRRPALLPCFPGVRPGFTRARGSATRDGWPGADQAEPPGRSGGLGESGGGGPGDDTPGARRVRRGGP